MASTYLNRTFSTPTNNKKWTYSLWVKRASPSTDNGLLSCGANGNNRGLIYISSGNTLGYFDTDSGTDTTTIVTNRLFRDVSAWYHIVIAVDTTQATSSDRVKIYVNGTQETSLSSSTYPLQNYDGYINSGIRHDISGRNHQGTSDLYFDGEMAHVNFIDGTAYDASAFGETDATTGIWKPKTTPSVTYGNNGFFLKFENSGAFGTDSSGNANNFTVNGTMTQTIDTPSNVFATMNPLDKTPFGTSITYSDGNTTTTASAGTDWTTRYSFSSLAITQGKWYAECKVGNVGVSNQFYLGVIKDRQTATINSSLGGIANGYGYYANSGNILNNGSDLSTSGASYTTGDIIGMALDLDNGTLDFYKNGVAQGDQVTGLDTSALWQFANNAYQNAIWNWNFGNPPFTIASGNSDANGYGNFEYAVPSGYYALNTKNLAQYG